MAVRRAAGPAFLSLKWQVLALLSVALVLINSSFFLLSERNLRGQAALSMQARHRQHGQELRGIVSDSAQHLEQLAGLLPAFADLPPLLAAGDTQGVVRTFAPYWPTLHLEMGVEDLGVHDTTGGTVAGWSVGGGSQRPTAAEVAAVVATEGPRSLIDCRVVCTQYVILPFRADGEAVGALTLGRSVASVVLSIHQILGSDIGLLALTDGHGTDDPDLGLPNWQMRVAALSNADRNLPLLRQLSQQRGDAPLESRGGVVSSGGHAYDIQLVPLKLDHGKAAVLAAVIDDITDQQVALRRATLENLSIGALGFVSSEILLLLLLWRPMSRLRRIAGALPLLAERAFDQARAALGPERSPPLRDETDVLDHSAAALIARLQTLESELEAQRAALAAKVGELATERERYLLAARGANDGLWDWDLRRGSAYFSPRWKSMLGYEEQEIGDSPDEWLGRLHPSDAERLAGLLADQQEGAASQFEDEHRLLHKDGHYVWVLCRAISVPDAQGRACRMSGSLTDVTARKHAEMQLMYDAMHDALTGLPNRALFLDRVSQTVRMADRNPGLRFAVLFMDVDRFKTINDGLGHYTGDQLLISVARRLRSALRPADTVARLGGDEFAVLLPEVGGEPEARALADRIQEQAGRPMKLGGRKISVTLSIGVVLNGHGLAAVEELLQAADTAMYKAKASGRARSQLFSPDMHRESVHKLELEEELRQALGQNELRVHYQPIIDLETGKIVSVEALARWPHPERGPVSPGLFIPLAEETGLISRIGKLVLETACRQRRDWGPLVAREFRIAVNLSARQFTDAALMDGIMAAVSGAGIEPDQLELELTESTLMDNPERASHVLNELHDIGIQLTVDDFGTGYSSLAYLRSFPFRKLKIDRTFVSNITLSSDEATIALAVIALAHSLRMRVVAEGVETRGQLGYLLRHQCDLVQGYLFGRPMPAAELEALLREPVRFDRDEFRQIPDQRRVLVVDDDRTVLLTLEALLRREGYAVLTAQNPVDAAELLATQEVGVIICDQELPVVSGIELLSQLKVLYPNMMRIVLTGHADLDTVTAAVNRGAAYKFVTKPWNNRALAALVHEAYTEYGRKRYATASR